MEIVLAVAKVGKYATSESGDSLEVIERPHGGLSAVLADGQRSGRAAKRISNIVVRKAIALLADGVRDGAAARAAHDYLRTHRGGQVSSTLNIMSVDLDTKSLVISRNSHCPVLIHNPGWTGSTVSNGWIVLDHPSEAIGIHARTRPVITELPLEVGTTAIVFTDGVWTAGERYGQPIDLLQVITDLMANRCGRPQELADCILTQAVEHDKGRPVDDMSLLVLGIRENEHEDRIRRMAVYLPLET